MIIEEVGVFDLVSIWISIHSTLSSNNSQLTGCKEFGRCSMVPCRIINLSYRHNISATNLCR